MEPTADIATTPTPRQIDCLRAIVRHLRKWGYPPSMRELGAALEVDKMTAQRFVGALDDSDLIYRTHNGPRCIVVTVAGWRALGLEAPEHYPRFGH